VHHSKIARSMTLWVSFAKPTRSRPFRHVRFAPIASEARQRNDARIKRKACAAEKSRPGPTAYMGQ
jgi:hypothetical protein